MAYTLLVGVDWADKCHDVCFVDSEGERLDEFEVKHTGEGLEGLADRIAAGVESPEQAAVVIERPHGPVVETLVQREFHVYHVNPKQLDRFRDRHRLSGAKDDRLDAYVLADSLRNDRALLRRVRLDEPTIIQLRELSRLDDQLGKDLSRHTNHLREQLRRYYPQMLELVSAADKSWLWNLWELAPTPAAARKLKPGRVNALLRKNRIRRFTAKQVLETLRSKPLRVAPGVTEAAQSHIRVLMPQLALTLKQRREGERQMETLLKQMSTGESPDDETNEHRDAALLLSLPGVGTRIAATMLSEANQPLTERNYHRLRRYCGAAPVTIQSGRKKNSRQKLERKGRVVMRRACNERLRDAVFHWARVSAQKEPRAEAHYARLRAKGHSHGRALRTIAERNLKMLVAMLRTGQRYDPAMRNEPLA